MTNEQMRRKIWECSWKSNGRAPNDLDYAYWLGKRQELEDRGVEIGIPDYAERRMLGWQAGGADAPTFGEYAIPPSPYHAVPPYPGDQPTPGPGPTPAPPGDLDARFAEINNKLDLLLAEAGELLLVAHAIRAPDYQGRVFGQSILLTPVGRES